MKNAIKLAGGIVFFYLSLGLDSPTESCGKWGRDGGSYDLLLLKGILPPPTHNFVPSTGPEKKNEEGKMRDLSSTYFSGHTMDAKPLRH